MMPLAETSVAPLGILAGGGRLPAQLIESCKTSGRPVFILGFEGTTDPALYEASPHAVVRIEAVGQALAHLREAGVRELVLAGKMRRPSLIGLKPDKTTAKLLAHLGSAFFSGDNALFVSLVSFLEAEGFTVIGVESVMQDIVTANGVLGAVKPNPQDLADSQKGLQIAKAMGALDIGQAAVVENGYVLAVEAAEGTDAMLLRCAALKSQPRGGVLVKAKKPAQETRADLPAIGIATVENAHAAGLAGIALEAEGSLILDKAQVIARADALGLFIMGIGDAG